MRADDNLLYKTTLPPDIDDCSGRQESEKEGWCSAMANKAYELVLLGRAAERHRLAALAGAVLARHPSYPLAPSSAAAISSCFVGNRCA